MGRMGRKRLSSSITKRLTSYHEAASRQTPFIFDGLSTWAMKITQAITAEL